MRSIGIVNGGGDAPSLNSVIRTSIRAAIRQQHSPRGRTILATTNRGNPFTYNSISAPPE